MPDAGRADALIGYGEIPAGAIHFDGGAMLAAAIFELPAALPVERSLDGRKVSARVGKKELGTLSAR